MIAIKIVCDALGRKTSFDGSFVMRFNPDARNGRGELVTSFKQSDALLFLDTSAAHMFWTQQSKRFPKRPDGKPNRPLTAYSVELVPVDVTPIATKH